MMTDEVRALLSEALRLPTDVRLLFADALIDSVPVDESGLPEGWSAEVDRREAEIESGAVQPIPWDQARSIIFRRDG